MSWLGIVIVIIAVMTTIGVLSMGTLGQDRELDTEVERYTDTVSAALEQAVLEGRDFGVHFGPDAYEIYTYAPERNRWESLPDDVKKAVEEVSGFAAIEKIAVQYGKIRAGVEKTAADRGAIIYRLPDAEYQRWQNTSKSIWEKWVKDMTAKGYPAKDVLARTQELIKKYNGEK